MSREHGPSLPISPHNHPLNPTRPTSEQRLQNNKTCTRWHVHTYTLAHTHTQCAALTDYKTQQTGIKQGGKQSIRYVKVFLFVLSIPLQKLKPTVYLSSPTSVAKYCFCSRSLGCIIRIFPRLTQVLNVCMSHLWTTQQSGINWMRLTAERRMKDHPEHQVCQHVSLMWN